MIWKRREDKAGPQERRLKAGNVRVYERGQEAIQILAEDEPDPAFQRELVYYHQEIVASREICSHHQPAAGQAI